VQVSAEMRWFWSNSCPTAVEKWFRESGCPPGGGHLPPRIDRYYHSRGNTELGIKVRNEVPNESPDVEVKGLVGILSDLGPGLPAQHVEMWCKWKAPPIGSNFSLVTEKVRWIRKFDASSDFAVEVRLQEDERPVSGEKPDVGCNIELTQVNVRQHLGTWWTLGFEAFGNIQSAPDALLKTIKAMGLLPHIDGELLSYPAWLDKF
jgi:hypothetical protein